MAKADKRYTAGFLALAQDAEAKSIAVSEMLSRLGYRLWESPAGIVWEKVRK